MTLPLIAGAVLWGLAYWPFPLGWLAWFSLAPLILAAANRRPTEALRLGWTFGAISWAVGMPWLADAGAAVSQGPRSLAIVAAAGIYVYSGLMLGLWAAAVAALTPPLARRFRASPLAAAACVSVPMYVFIEWLFPLFIPTQVANSQYFHLPLIQSAELFGMGGLCWLLLCLNAAAAYAAGAPRQPRRWKPAAVAAALLLANEAYGLARMRALDVELARRRESGPILRAALLQSSIEDTRRFSPAHAAENLAAHNDLAARAAAAGSVDLLLWPENTYGTRFGVGADDEALERLTLDGRPAAQRLRREVAAHGADVLLGGVAEVDDGRKQYVSVLLGSDGTLRGAVGKRNLTPLVDWIPSLHRFPALMRRLPPGVWMLRPGPHRVLTTGSGARLGVSICYDGVFARNARDYVRAGAQVLVNPANNGLPGTVQPEEYIRLVSMRAVETRRFVLHPSAFSAVTDPAGRVIARLPYGAREALRVEVPLMEGLTPAARLGDWPYASAGVMLLGLAVVALRKA